MQTARQKANVEKLNAIKSGKIDNRQSTIWSQPSPWSQDNISTTPAVTNPTLKIPKVNFGGNSSITDNIVTTPPKTPGVALSTGGMTTPTAAPKFDDDLLFWEAAKQKELASWGAYLAKRNDYLAQDFFYNAPSFNKDTVENDIYTYLKQKGITWSQDDITNTVRAIRTQVAAMKQPDPLQNELDAVDRKYAKTKEQLLSSGAIEDRYTNFNEVNNEITNVTTTAGQYMADNKIKGMPTDQDIQKIAQKSWVSFERAKRIMEGYWYETLQMQPEFAAETNRWYNRAVSKREIERNRTLEDLQTQLDQTKQKIQRQQQDIMQKAERNISAISMLGALRGYTNTSGFTKGITQVHDDAIELVNRLETQLRQAESATDKDRARLLENYNIALAQAKEDLDLQTRDINVQMGTKYSSILSQYGGDVLYDKLKEFNSELLDAKISVVNNYVDVIGKLNKQKYDEADQIMKMDNYLRGNQKDNLGLLTQNDGQILTNYSINDLASMYKSGDLSLNDYKMLQSAMLTKAQNTLYDQGTPTDADFTALGDYLEQWMSVHDAIVATIQQSNGRLEPLTTRKGETTSSTKKSWAAGDRAIRHSNPTAMTVDVAKTLGLVEGVDYEKGDAFVGSWGKQLYTARFKWDPLATTIKALDIAAQSPNKSAFYTQWWSPRRTHTAIPDAKRLAMSKEQKEEVVKEMFDRESPYSWDDMVANAGKNAGLKDTFEAVNVGYASAGDITKAMKENKVWPVKFLQDYLKEKAPTYDEWAIYSAWATLKAASKEFGSSSVVIPALKANYGTDATVKFLIKNYATALEDKPEDFSKLVAAAIGKGTKYNEDVVRDALDEAGYGRNKRRKFINKLDDLLWL